VHNKHGQNSRKMEIRNKMKLVKTQKEIEVALKAMLMMFFNEIVVLKRTPSEAANNTLKSYDDFAEWLQGKVR
jgi:hypothetical protein